MAPTGPCRVNCPTVSSINSRGMLHTTIMMRYGMKNAPENEQNHAVNVTCETSVIMSSIPTTSITPFGATNGASEIVGLVLGTLRRGTSN